MHPAMSERTLAASVLLYRQLLEESEARFIEDATKTYGKEHPIESITPIIESACARLQGECGPVLEQIKELPPRRRRYLETCIMKPQPSS